MPYYITFKKYILMAVFQCVLNFVILHILWDFFKESIGFIKLPKRSVVPKKKKKRFKDLDQCPDSSYS